jgi:hypothetical protein
MQLPALDTNIIISVILLALGVYGIIAGKQRLRILILSVYVGIVLAGQMASVVRPYLTMLGEDQVTWLLLGAPIVVFGFIGIVHKKHHSKGSFIANLLVGLMTGALIISSALHLLPTSQMAAITNDSVVALFLEQNHLWFLGLLPIIALIMGFMSGEKSSHH